MLEEILRDTNDYAKGYEKMREVDDGANHLAASLGQQPSNVQLIFGVPDGID